jgi:neutral trehalase
MWRGPIWINYNVLVFMGLKEYGYHDLVTELTSRTLDMIDEWYYNDGTIYEFYDPTNTTPPNRLIRKGPTHRPYDYRIHFQTIKDFGWSNSLYPYMCFELL